MSTKMSEIRHNIEVAAHHILVDHDAELVAGVGELFEDVDA